MCLEQIKPMLQNVPDIAITFAATAVANGAARLVPFAMK